MKYIIYIIMVLVLCSFAYSDESNNIYGFTDWQIEKIDYFQNYINYNIVKVDEFNYILKWEKGDSFVWDALETCVYEDNETCMESVANKSYYKVKEYGKIKEGKKDYKIKDFADNYFDKKDKVKIKNDVIKLKNNPFPKNKTKGVILKGEVDPIKKNKGQINISLPFESLFMDKVSLSIGFETLTISKFSNNYASESINYTFFKGNRNFTNTTRFLIIPIYAEIFDARMYVSKNVSSTYSPYQEWDYFDDQSINADIWNIIENVGVVGSASYTEQGYGSESVLLAVTSENEVGSPGRGETTSIDVMASDESNSPFVELEMNKSLLIRYNYTMQCTKSNVASYSHGGVRFLLTNGTTTSLTGIREMYASCGGAVTSRTRTGNHYIKIIVNQTTTNVSIYNVSDGSNNLIATVDYSGLSYSSLYLDIRSEAQISCGTGDNCYGYSNLKLKEIGYTINITNYNSYTSLEGWEANYSYLEVGTPDGSGEWNYTSSGLVNLTSKISSSIPSCNCTGCVLSSGNCYIPFLFYSPYGGILNYSGISVSYNVTSANVTVHTYDADTLALIKNVNITIQAIGEIFQQETHTNMTGNASFTLPFNSSESDDIEFRAFQKEPENEDYTIVMRHLSVEQGDNLELNFYMQNTTNQSRNKKVQIIVKDEFYNNLQGALIHVFRQNPSNNTFLAITDLTTGQDGTAEGYFVIDTAFYKFTVEYQGSLIYTSPEPRQIGDLTDQIVLRGNVGGDFDEYYQTILGVITTLNFVQVSNTSGKFTASYSNPSSIEVCFNISIINSTGFFGQEYQCLNGSDGTFESAVYSPSNVTLYEARLTADFDDGYGHRFLRNLFEYIGVTTNVNSVELVIIILVAIAIAGFGFTQHPVAGLTILAGEFIILLVISKAVGFRGLMPIAEGMVIVCLAIISIFTITRRR